MLPLGDYMAGVRHIAQPLCREPGANPAVISGTNCGLSAITYC
jgi:hypothetical protein